MSLGSQSGNLQTTTTANGLLHEVFVKNVVPQVRASSATGQAFQEAGSGDYTLVGTKLKGAARLSFTGGAMSTSTGKLPDHQFVNPVNWEVTPVRRHQRVALDNMMEERGVGAGAYKDLVPYLFELFWDAWERMHIRQSIGGSDGYVCLCSSRTDNNTIVVKDGYGHSGTSPLLYLRPGMKIAWLDASASYAAAGAATIDSMSGTTINLDSSSTWEPSATIAADDPIVFATTDNISTDYFDTEKDSAPNGVKTIVDPDDDLTTVFNISEDTHTDWKPYRETSSTFDHIEVTDHWRKLAAQSMAPVTPDSHIAIAQGAVISELARTLEGFQQQMGLGQTFEGGYQAVRIAGRDILQDDFFFHDILMTLCKETLFYVPLGAGAGMSSPDGSEWSRLPDQDAKEAYASEYLQFFSPQRNRHAALTGITLANYDADDFTPVRS